MPLPAVRIMCPANVEALQTASIQWEARFFIIPITRVTYPMGDHQVPAAKITPFVPQHLAKMTLAKTKQNKALGKI